MSLVIYAFKRLQCLHSHFKRLQCLYLFTLSKDYNVFIYISKDFNIFSHLRFQKTTMFSFTFQRHQCLLSFIGLNVLVFMLHRNRRPLFLCFEKKGHFRCLSLYRTSMSLCFLNFTSLVLQLPGQIAISLERS